MVAYLSGSLGWDYFRRLQQNGAKIVQSTNTVGTDIAQGSVEVGISLDSVGRDLGNKGSPVLTAWPSSGAIPVPAPVAIVKGHESSVAQAFIDWLLTDQGQAELVKLGYAPIRGRSEAVPANAKVVDVDWTQVAADRDSTIQQFKAIFP
jgi:iron(III) transport system substrate-binding protein